MATNQFKPFATGAGATVTEQADWEVLPALLTGFQAGKASSAQVNKALRQATFIAAAIAEFVAEKTASEVADDGDLDGFVTKLTEGFAAEYLSRANPGADIVSDGTVDTFLSNLGLGEGSALPVGVPVPYPLSTPPAGWLKCNGAVFTAAQYPKLALAYPDLTLPDLRGEFIRGWDDGRGVDSNRVLLSNQGHAMQQHTHTVEGLARISDYDRGDSNSLWSIDNVENKTTSNASGNTASETRPRNIAFNFIVRAA